MAQQDSVEYRTVTYASFVQNGAQGAKEDWFVKEGWYVARSHFAEGATGYFYRDQVLNTLASEGWRFVTSTAGFGWSNSYSMLTDTFERTHQD